MPTPILDGHNLAWVGVVGVLIPAVVGAKVLAGVVGWVGDDEVDLPAIAIERGHDLEVVPLDDEVARLVFGAAATQAREATLDARPQLAEDRAHAELAGEVDPDARLGRRREHHLHGGGDGQSDRLLRLVDSLSDLLCHRHPPLLYSIPVATPAAAIRRRVPLRVPPAYLSTNTIKPSLAHRTMFLVRFSTL